MKSGAKGQIKVEPLNFTGWPEDRAARRERFIAEFLITPKGAGAGEPFRLRDWQTDIVRGAFAPGVRTGLVSLPRGNGKSALAAALAVAELFVGPASAEVLVVASDQRQANIVLRMARRMIELNPELADRTHIYSDRLQVPENDSILQPLPAEPGALHGHDPSLLIVDELHVVTTEVWEAVTSVSGKRPKSLTLAISTPATTPDCIMWGLIEHGRAGDDRSFYLREYAAPDGCAVNDREAWRIANPALGDFLAEDGMESVMRTLREPIFRQLRLGQWVGQAEGWLPWGSWDALSTAEDVPDGAKVVLGFDGSASGDSTALVGCTTAGHVFVVNVWQNPGDQQWRVPRGEVDQAIDLAFNRWDVAELACDPFGWRSEIEQWAARHGERRVVEWPTNVASRMGPACDRFYAAVMEKALTHDGDRRLSAHLSHCVAKPTTYGDVITKDKRNSPRKIDAAVAAVVAHDRAAFHAKKKPRGRAAGFR